MEESSLNSHQINFKKHFTVKQLAIKNRQNGTWPDSESSIWALKSNSPENGFGSAFLKVGRRVLVDEGKFWEAVDNLQEVRNASKK